MEEEICEKKGSDTEAQQLEERVFHLLREKGLTLSTAESCTGGLVAARIVNVPGSSEVLKAGLITYTNKMKRKYLGVKKSTLRKYTAVSKETAREMAKGGCRKTGTDVCVSVTGFAGPDGGGKDQPAGLVYIGCCAGDHVTVRRFLFAGGRNEVRRQAAEAALRLLGETVQKIYS